MAPAYIFRILRILFTAFLELIPSPVNYHFSRLLAWVTVADVERAMMRTGGTVKRLRFRVARQSRCSHPPKTVIFFVIWGPQVVTLPGKSCDLRRLCLSHPPKVVIWLRDRGQSPWRGRLWFQLWFELRVTRLRLRPTIRVRWAPFDHVTIFGAPIGINKHLNQRLLYLTQLPFTYYVFYSYCRYCHR